MDAWFDPNDDGMPPPSDAYQQAHANWNAKPRGIKDGNLTVFSVTDLDTASPRGYLLKGLMAPGELSLSPCLNRGGGAVWGCQRISQIEPPLAAWPLRGRFHFGRPVAGTRRTSPEQLPPSFPQFRWGKHGLFRFERRGKRE